MNSCARKSLILAVLVLLSEFASSTPIVVLRTKDGFLAGTNSKRSNGDIICKVHYVGKKLLLFSSNQAAMYIKTPEGKVRMIFDLNEDLWQFPHSIRSDRALLDWVKNVIVRDIKKNAPASFGNGLPRFNLVLISTDEGKPTLTTMVIQFRNEGIIPDVNTIPYDLPIGTALIWNFTNEPRLRPMDADGLLEDLNLAQQFHAKAGPVEDQGYNAPFVVLALDQYGLRFVKGDPRPCTIEHPLPFPNALKVQPH